jgi:proteasome lid subunit RPN8/RPN11
MLIISPEIENIIRADGVKAYPNECCGVLMGTVGENEAKTVTHAEPINNAREDGEQYHRFLITPEEMMRAELAARSKKLDVVGFYHSHPDHPAKPSEYDKDHALPFYSYAIVSVMKGEPRDLTSWELSADRTVFTQENIDILR